MRRKFPGQKLDLLGYALPMIFCGSKLPPAFGASFHLQPQPAALLRSSPDLRAHTPLLLVYPDHPWLNADFQGTLRLTSAAEVIQHAQPPVTHSWTLPPSVAWLRSEGWLVVDCRTKPALLTLPCPVLRFPFNLSLSLPFPFLSLIFHSLLFSILTFLVPHFVII
ncbi:hypothetical protein BJX61DRAFT_223202 [Aspergillus egyptiacus]|nr:hypothetical protein BJX61DRAFT_223202 [Aspergillus egyptiacus]